MVIVFSQLGLFYDSGSDKHKYAFHVGLCGSRIGQSGSSSAGLRGLSAMALFRPPHVHSRNSKPDYYPAHKLLSTRLSVVCHDFPAVLNNSLPWPRRGSIESCLPLFKGAHNVVVTFAIRGRSGCRRGSVYIRQIAGQAFGSNFDSCSHSCSCKWAVVHITMPHIYLAWPGLFSYVVSLC